MKPRNKTQPFPYSVLLAYPHDNESQIQTYLAMVYGGTVEDGIREGIQDAVKANDGAYEYGDFQVLCTLFGHRPDLTPVKENGNEPED